MYYTALTSGSETSIALRNGETWLRLPLYRALKNIWAKCIER